MGHKVRVVVAKIFQKARKLFYFFLSSQKVSGRKNQPVLFEGYGKIQIADNVSFGVKTSPYFYSGYTYIESRKKSSLIVIGDNTHINNSATIISDGASIRIGKNCLIGVKFQILDSDFHNINPIKRFGNYSNEVVKKDVIIEDNVFIGNNVTVLKGVIIGQNSVIANGSVVSKNVPRNTICGGNVAKVIREL